MGRKMEKKMKMEVEREKRRRTTAGGRVTTCQCDQ
jgi:hypothetical protein